MLTITDTIVLCILIFLSIVLTILLNYLLNKKNKKQMDKIFIITFGLIMFWILCSVLQLFCVNFLNAEPIYFDYFVYISVCFLPVAFLFLALIFSRTKITFSKKYILLFIVPTISLILLWTNNWHHLFFKEYTTNITTTQYGPYFSIIHYNYTFVLYILSLFILMKNAIKNSGFFSRQAMFILVGVLIPFMTSILSFMGVTSGSIYETPITFAVAVILFMLGTFRFNLFKTSPISLQKIVDKISDSYIILNEDDVITDFNATFLETFNLKENDVRNKNLFKLISYTSERINEKKLRNALEQVKNNSKTLYFDKKFELYQKYFHIEISTIMAKQSFLGILILFKDTTQHMEDMQTIIDNQDMLMESERLASLGQLIGGIAHNLKTPIMSIAGAAEGLNDLIREYDSSIEDNEVTFQDHHDIARDMNSWVNKIKEYTEYMSDIITTVKGQAVVMSEQDSYNFTIDEFVKRVDILMKHELKNALINLKTNIKVDGNLEIKGNVNSLVQVINNMISNSIQAYNGRTNENIEFTIYKQDSNIIISIKDYAGGLSKEVSEKLFKEMITTKGKNGTGLGLFMSYSNIRAHFNGNILAYSTPGVGTEFKIILPV